MLNDSRIASNRHLRRLYELDPEATPDFGDVTCMTCPPFWEYRQPVTLENFKLFVQEKTVMNEGGSFQLLTFGAGTLHASFCNKLFATPTFSKVL